MPDTQAPVTSFPSLLPNVVLKTLDELAGTITFDPQPSSCRFDSRSAAQLYRYARSLWPIHNKLCPSHNAFSLLKIFCKPLSHTLGSLEGLGAILLPHLINISLDRAPYGPATVLNTLAYLLHGLAGYTCILAQPSAFCHHKPIYTDNHRVSTTERACSLAVTKQPSYLECPDNGLDGSGWLQQSQTGSADQDHRPKSCDTMGVALSNAPSAVQRRGPRWR
jgi:uncharacterized membrane protein YuzA (DUF378 family)